MNESSIPKPAHRRLKYGLSIAVLILAALVIVVVLNVISYRHYQRFDFTATRRYSLSPQTLKLLKNLEQPVTVTALYAQGSQAEEYTQPVMDLLTEYSRRSDKLTVRKIDPTVNVEDYTHFTQELLQRYKTELDSYRQGIKQTQGIFARLREFAEQQRRLLPAAIARLPERDAKTRPLLSDLDQYFSRLPSGLELVDNEIQQGLSSPLPDVKTARAAALQRLREVRDKVIVPAQDYFQKLLADSSLPGPTRDFLLGSVQAYRPLQDDLTTAIQQLEALPEGEYEQVREKVMQANSVVLAADARLTVLTLREVYAPPASQNPDDEKPEYRFKGEEVLTGALVSLTMKVKPMVLFVHSLDESVLGYRGSYSHVAELLRNMNMDVQEWTPAPRANAMGQPGPVTPMPLPKPGQTMVMIVLPPSQPSPQMPFNPFAPQVADAVKTQLASGEPVMIFTGPQPMVGFGAPVDQTLELLQKDWGISVDVGRIVLEARAGQGGREQLNSNLVIKDWPEGRHAIDDALRGLTGVLVAASPIHLPDQSPAGITYTPLIETSASVWADNEMYDLRRAKRDPNDPSGPFIAAVAAQKGKQRIILVADASFASDPVTTFASVRLVTGEALYYDFPANAEFFVNGTYWLAGLDDLIAAGARSQDVRRIAAMSRPAVIAVWWISLAALPLGCLAAGLIVWSYRRR